MRTNGEKDPVQVAVLRRSLSELRTALAGVGQVDALDREGRSALFYTVKDGDLPMTEELVRHGANVNLRDGAGKTPLHFAGIHFQPAAAQFLIDHGADVSIADGHGNTPLSDAVYYAKSDQGEVILALLAAGADKHQKNKHGSSPYLLANLIATTNVRQFLVGE